MRVLLVHTEAKYFAGAEKMLLYYLRDFKRADIQITIALIKGSKLADLIPEHFNLVLIPDNQRFSVRSFGSQVKILAKSLRSQSIDLIHGWSARDWELSSILGLAGGSPAIGTLHDHPRASFISSKRQMLMRAVANRGLAKVICVSDAVRKACVEASYAAEKLDVVRNGLPIPSGLRTSRNSDAPFHIGFLGAFTERKGLRTFFEILEALERSSGLAWNASIAGGAQDPAGEELTAQVREKYNKSPWWPRVRWIGWIERPEDFLNTLDLLVVPSSEFDPFPTVLLEAGFASLPVIASNVGGVGEIINDGETGWLFEPGRANAAADLICNLIDSPAMAREAGRRARHRVETHFSAQKMIANYCQLYSSVMANR